MDGIKSNLNYASNYNLYFQEPDSGQSQSKNNALLSEIASEQVNMSACAWIGKRPLSALPWLGALSSSPNSILDRLNIELSHQHIWFDDSGSNIGYSPDGLFSEDIGSKNYETDGVCYDPSKLRAVFGAISSKGISSYNWITSNCQGFVSRVLSAYNSL